MSMASLSGLERFEAYTNLHHYKERLAPADEALGRVLLGLACHHLPSLGKDCSAGFNPVSKMAFQFHVSPNSSGKKQTKNWCVIVHKVCVSTYMERSCGLSVKLLEALKPSLQ